MREPVEESRRMSVGNQPARTGTVFGNLAVVDPVKRPGAAPARPVAPARPGSPGAEVAPAAAAAQAAARRGSLVDPIALAFLIGGPLILSLWFFPYYSASLVARVRSPYHLLLRPWGPVGLSFGVAGAALFFFMWLYPLRKHAQILSRVGNLGMWLRIHIIAGLTLPVVVAVHAGWRFTGVIGLGYWAMMLVIASGVVGRYLYVHIPRARNGVELTRDQIVAERRALVTEIAAATGLDPTQVERTLAPRAAAAAGRKGLGALWVMFLDDLDRGRTLRALERAWSRPRPGVGLNYHSSLPAALRLARREMALGQQMRLLDATHSLFSWWHILHLPVAVTAFLSLIIHIAVAVLVGGVFRGGTP
jgi:hypothetical protein